MKVALIGSAPSSVRLAPYTDPTWRIIGCSPGVYGVAPRVDEWMEGHLWEPGQPWYSPEYVQWLTALPARGVKLWMGAPNPGAEGYSTPPLAGATVPPWKEWLAKYDPNRWFCSSSLFWMMCRAIDAITEEAKAQGRSISRERDKIAFYGVDMAACTSPDARVLTADLRWIRSDEVKVGDKLIAFDEHATPGLGGGPGNRKWQVTEVTQAERMRKPSYAVTLADGRVIQCSEQHKWLTHAENECRWKLTSELVTKYHRPGRHTHIVKLFDPWEEDRSWEAGYLSAAFDGEGHLTQTLKGEYGQLLMGFAQRENAMSRTVLSICDKLNVPLSLASSDERTGNGACNKYAVRGGRAKTMEILGRIRPRRLLAGFDPSNLGIMRKSDTVAVVSCEPIGEQDVIGLKTTTGTLVVEGLASHNSEEYSMQRAGIHFLTYAALGMGIEVGVPKESDLFTPRFAYGFDEWSHSFRKWRARRAELTARRDAAELSMQQYRDGLHFLKGAIEDVDYMHDTWVTKDDFTGPDGPGSGWPFAQPLSADTDVIKASGVITCAPGTAWVQVPSGNSDPQPT